MYIRRVVACVLVLWSTAFAVCTADEALLRQAWTYRAGPRQEELTAAKEQFDLLVARMAEDQTLASRLGETPEARWLLTRRQAAYLVIDEQLALEAEGAALTAVLYLAGRMGYRNLSPRIAALLKDAEDNARRLEVVCCLSALQGRAAVNALVQFLQSPPEDADEAVLVGAVRGLGHSRRPDVIPVIRSAQSLIRTPAGMYECAKAACRCGEEASIAAIVALAENDKATRELRLDAIAFLCESFCDAALEPLARIAVDSADEQLRMAATWALINGTGYGRPEPEPLPMPPPEPTKPKAAPADGAPPAEPEDAAPDAGAPPAGRQDAVPDTEAPPEPTDLPAGVQPQPDAAAGEAGPLEPVPAGPVQPLPGLPPDLSELDEDERRVLVQTLVDWWRTEGRERSVQRAAHGEVFTR